MENNITISMERYEHFLDIETRVNVLVDFLYHDEYCKKKDILRVIGTEDALLKVAEIEERERQEHEEYLRKKKELENANV